MLKLKFALFAVVSAAIISGCALGEVSNATPLPPITLAPPPALRLAGTCDDTKILETWLQVTSELRTNFQTLMNIAAAKDKVAMYEDVINLAALRDAAFAAETPDCAAETGIKLSDTMSQAVLAFQLFANGDATDLGNTVTETNTQLDTIAAAQTELITRMDAQFQQQRQATTEP
jgi:hypothetical protein